MANPDPAPEQQASLTRGTDDDTSRPTGREATGGMLSRPLVWLGTLSTVVAIATGMFSLRDQIFPSDAGTATASASVYETSVGEICMALNQANSALMQNADDLANRLANARTPLAQRNAVLDSWTVVLNSSQYELGLFEGLDVPGAFDAREHVTAAAWNRIVARLRGFTRQLDDVSADAALIAAVQTLPAIGEANATDVVTRTAGLTELGGGRCVLNPPANPPTITIPPLPGAVTVGVNVTPSMTSSPGVALGNAAGSSRGNGSAALPVGPGVAPGNAGSSGGGGRGAHGG